MDVHVVGQVPSDLRAQAVVVALVLLIAVLVGVLVVVRTRRVTRTRARSGLRALRAAELNAVRSAGLDARGADEDAVRAAAELARQKAWEQKQAGLEVARYGRGMTRAYCSTHDRWCKHPERGPHPPGGHEFEAAPPDWEPDRGPLG